MVGGDRPIEDRSMSNSPEPVISVKIGGISRDVLIASGSANNRFTLKIESKGSGKCYYC